MITERMASTTAVVQDERCKVDLLKESAGLVSSSGDNSSSKCGYSRNTLGDLLLLVLVIFF